jgi:4-aminobutyrate--pyruvate transaminase
VAFAQEEGLLTRAVAGDNIALCPPLIISPAEIDDMFDKLTRALDRTLDYVTREKLITP